MGPSKGDIASFCPLDDFYLPPQTYINIHIGQMKASPCSNQDLKDELEILQMDKLANKV